MVPKLNIRGQKEKEDIARCVKKQPYISNCQKAEGKNGGGCFRDLCIV